jgi:hypothetical protein
MACHLWRLAAVDLTQSWALTEIGEGAFRGCAELKSVVAPASLQKVGQEAFGCPGLREFDASLESPVMGELPMAYCVLLDGPVLEVRIGATRCFSGVRD